MVSMTVSSSSTTRTRGAPLLSTASANMRLAEYPPEEHAELRKVLSMGNDWNPDRVIVLTSSTDTIDKHIRQRNRAYEGVENMVRRFRLIDGEFRRLAPRYPNTIVINRDGLEFHDRAGLTHIIALAGLPPFREIPYNEIERYTSE